MKEYKNTILMKDMDDGHIDAIILTNEDKETIQKAIYKAKSQYIDGIDELDDLSDFIHCEYDYIYYYLCENYEIEFLENWYDNNVYY